MTRLTILTGTALLALAAAAIAAEAPSGEAARQQGLFTAASPGLTARPGDTAAWEALAQTEPDPAMGIGDPHPMAARALAAAADAAAERSRHEDLARWDSLFSHEPYFNMGVGGHGG